MRLAFQLQQEELGQPMALDLESDMDEDTKQSLELARRLQPQLWLPVGDVLPV